MVFLVLPKLLFSPLDAYIVYTTSHVLFPIDASGVFYDDESRSLAFRVETSVGV